MMEIKSMMPANALPLTDPRLMASAGARSTVGKDAVPARKVAQEFEAMFVGLMLKSMRDTVGKDKLTGGGHGEETFRSLLDQEYAATAARNGGIGLARSIEKDLMRGGGPQPVSKVVGDAD